MPAMPAQRIHSINVRKDGLVHTVPIGGNHTSCRLQLLVPSGWSSYEEATNDDPTCLQCIAHVPITHFVIPTDTP